MIATRFPCERPHVKPCQACRPLVSAEQAGGGASRRHLAVLAALCFLIVAVGVWQWSALTGGAL